MLEWKQRDAAEALCKHLDGNARPDLDPPPADFAGRISMLERQHGQLVQAIEAQIVPRLVLAGRAQLGRPEAGLQATGETGGCGEVSAEEVEHVALMALTQSVDVLLAHVEQLRSRNVSLESIYLDLLAPAARHLGDLWVADRNDFVEVTVGVGRLQQVLHTYDHLFRREIRRAQRRILLAPFPGEQHSFGLFMVAQFFRRFGWDVICETMSSSRDLGAAVAGEAFDVVGLSLGSAARLDGVALEIHTIRRVSRNRHLGIMVGGPVFVEDPTLAGRVGADATAVDGCRAVVQAEFLLQLAPRHN